MKYYFCVLSLFLALLGGCRPAEDSTDFPSHQLMPKGSNPSAYHHNGHYYYVQQSSLCDTLMIYGAPTLDSIATGRKRVVLTRLDSGMDNFYSPELHRIDGRWYLYFEADDCRNTDNHQLFVLENASDNPMEGDWTLHGPIMLHPEWNFALYPSTFTLHGRQYLLWSGWQHRRVESETQCIFIAEMENPWTLKTESSVITVPQYEWERQWINGDGTRSAYPIYVNENPEALLSPDGCSVVIAYSASWIGSQFNALGLIYASTESDLLDPRSWVKLPEPQFVAAPGDTIFGASNIGVATSDDPRHPYLLYEAKHPRGSRMPAHSIRYKQFAWDDHGLPIFGKP